MQVSGFRIYFLEPGCFFSKILSEFRKKIVALHKLTDFIKAFINVFQRIACHDFLFQCLNFQLLWCYKCIIPIIWQAKAL